MRFILTCTLGHDVEQQRVALRGKHLAYVAKNKDQIVFGGPSIGPLGKPEAMFLVVEAPDLAAAQRFSREEPYTANKVFADVQIRQWVQVMPEPHPGALAEEIAREDARASA